MGACLSETSLFKNFSSQELISSNTYLSKISACTTRGPLLPIHRNSPALSHFLPNHLRSLLFPDHRYLGAQINPLLIRPSQIHLWRNGRRRRHIIECRRCCIARLSWWRVVWRWRRVIDRCRWRIARSEWCGIVRPRRRQISGSLGHISRRRRLIIDSRRWCIARSHWRCVTRCWRRISDRWWWWWCIARTRR